MYVLGHFENNFNNYILGVYLYTGQARESQFYVRGNDAYNTKLI